MYNITGSSLIKTILGVKDGDVIYLVPSGAFQMDATDNIEPLTTTATVGRPVHLIVVAGTCFEVGPST